MCRPKTHCDQIIEWVSWFEKQDITLIAEPRDNSCGKTGFMKQNKYVLLLSGLLPLIFHISPSTAVRIWILYDKRLSCFVIGGNRVTCCAPQLTHVYRSTYPLLSNHITRWKLLFVSSLFSRLFSTRPNNILRSICIFYLGWHCRRCRSCRGIRNSCQRRCLKSIVRYWNRTQTDI